MIIIIIKKINNQKRTKSEPKAKQKRNKSETKANQMSSFTNQIITAANKINGVKINNNSSIQYFASRK